NKTGRLLDAATMNVNETRKVTLIFFNPNANIVEIIPIPNTVHCAARNCSFSVVCPFLIRWWYISCEKCVVADVIKHTTNATTVVNTTAETNANKKSPPNALDNNGAAKLPVESAIINVSYPTTATVPKPNRSVIK